MAGSGRAENCVACHRLPKRDWGLCTVCIWRLALEAAHAYDVERRHYGKDESHARALARLGAPLTREPQG